jgi:DNA-binding transcriptional regulator LsrR (DeoR family)
MYSTQSSRKSSEGELLGKVARLYYEYDLTHQEIAEVVHLSRVKVTRLLQQARDQGVVQIRVNSSASPYTDVESLLASELGLNEAVVVPYSDDPIKLRQGIARAAASYLQRILRDDMVVAISISRTIALIPKYVVDPRPIRATFAAAVGGLSRGSAGMNPHGPIDQLALVFGGVAEHMPAPAIVGSSTTAAALLKEPTIRATVERAASAGAILLGLGGVTGSVQLVEEGVVTRSELSELIRRGAVGDMSAHFYDREGRHIDHDLNRRIVGLNLDQIRAVPIRVVAAGGLEKVEALYAAVTSGLISVLVTDTKAAQGLLARGRAESKNPSRHTATAKAAAKTRLPTGAR